MAASPAILGGLAVVVLGILALAVFGSRNAPVPRTTQSPVALSERLAPEPAPDPSPSFSMEPIPAEPLPDAEAVPGEGPPVSGSDPTGLPPTPPMPSPACVEVSVGGGLETTSGRSITYRIRGTIRNTGGQIAHNVRVRLRLLGPFDRTLRTIDVAPEPDELPPGASGRFVLSYSEADMDQIRRVKADARWDNP